MWQLDWNFPLDNGHMVIVFQVLFSFVSLCISMFPVCTVKTVHVFLSLLNVNFV